MRWARARVSRKFRRRRPCASCASAVKSVRGKAENERHARVARALCAASSWSTPAATSSWTLRLSCAGGERVSHAGSAAAALRPTRRAAHTAAAHLDVHLRVGRVRLPLQRERGEHQARRGLAIAAHAAASTPGGAVPTTPQRSERTACAACAKASVCVNSGCCRGQQRAAWRASAAVGGQLGQLGPPIR